MDISLERSRIICTDYTPGEKKVLDDLVGTIDKVFSYEDPDGKMMCFPTGMLDSVKRTFPRVHVQDNSSSYWDYARIEPVEHNAQPRNQLQVDFIQFVLEHAKNGEKLAGILSPGTGKAEPVSRMIPTLNGHKFMGDMHVGDHVIGSDGQYKLVTGVFPQGVKEIYEITLTDGHTALCAIDHLWHIKNLANEKIEVVSLGRLMRRHYKDYAIPVGVNPMIYVPIESIKFSHLEEAQCIMVDSPDHLYMTEQEVMTHNTFMACYSAIRVGLRTLIIVPTSGIKAQWAETLTGMFSVRPERVKIVNSPKDFINVNSDFVIVSQASLAVLNNTYDLERIMKLNRFGIKVIDEVQMWFHNMIKVDANSNIFNNWYLTGTFGRSGEEENKLYQEMFGDLAMFREKDKKPTLFNRKPGNVYGMKPHMHIKMMWGRSGLSKEEVRAVSKSIRYSERAGKWMRYGISIPAYTELIIPSDGKMTKYLKDLLKIIKEAESSVDYGRTLILGSTIGTVEIVADYVRKMFPNKKVATYHSRNSKQENEDGKASCDILISTTSSCGTGFDMKDLSKLVVFAQYKSWILADQVSGRLRRRPDGKDTYMWDVVDSTVPQLRAWANARADVFQRKSKTFKVVDV